MRLRVPGAALLGVVLVGPALADDAACTAAARGHTSFKAVLAGDPVDQTQYETVRREGADNVEIVRYVDGEKRMARRTYRGLIAKEQEVFGGTVVRRVGMSHFIDPASLLPLRPNTVHDFRVFVVPGEFLRLDAATIGDARLSVGQSHEAQLGGCRLQVFDLTVETHYRSKSTTSVFTGEYAPDLAYFLTTTVEVTGVGKPTRIATRVADIEPWSGEASP